MVGLVIGRFALSVLVLLAHLVGFLVSMVLVGTMFSCAVVYFVFCFFVHLLKPEHQS